MYDRETKQYAGIGVRQIDPLESKKAGHNVYLTPGCGTLIPPPTCEEGFHPEFKAGNWIIAEDWKPPDEVIPETQEPNPEMVAEMQARQEEIESHPARIAALESQIADLTQRITALENIDRKI